MTCIARLSTTFGLALGGVFAGITAGGCAGTHNQPLATDRYTGERLPATIQEERAWGYPHAGAAPRTTPQDATAR